MLAGLAALRAQANEIDANLVDAPPPVVEILSTTQSGGVETTRLRYRSRIDLQTRREVLIYAILARPQQPGRHPAILVCHGGGANAELVAPHVIAWAKRGYVALCLDQPGICNPRTARSTGPCLDPKTPVFGIRLRATESALFDGVVASLKGLALLRAQPDVDPSLIGVTGGSWGGYMATMVAAVAGTKIRAVFSVYGAGYLDAGSGFQIQLDSLSPKRREMWLELLDPGRRAHQIRAAYFIASPTNDWWYWPPSVQRTYDRIPGEKGLCYNPNDSHRLRLPGGTAGPPDFDRKANRTYMEVLWFDHYLKNEGAAFPKLSAHDPPKRLDDTVRVEFEASGDEPFASTSVWYAAGELPWRMKWWRKVPATPAQGENRFTAVIPVDETTAPFCWFGLVSDRRHVSVSTRIMTVRPTELGFGRLQDSPSPFEQGFENPEEWSRWHRQYAEKRDGRLRITSAAAYEGNYGMELRGQAGFVCDGVRAKTLKRGSAPRLSFWIRAQNDVTPYPTMELLSEKENGERQIWRWPSSPPEFVAREWTRVEIPLRSFVFVGPNTERIGMFSTALGQLRISTDSRTHLQLDVIAVNPGAPSVPPPPNAQ